MGGLTSKGFLQARRSLCKDYDIGTDDQTHDERTGRNKQLDEILRRKETDLMRNQPAFRKMVSKGGKPKMLQNLIKALCHVGYGSGAVFEPWPDLEIIEIVLAGLTSIPPKRGTLRQERQKSPKKDNLFRLIRPLFLHRYSEAVVALVGAKIVREVVTGKYEQAETKLAALHRFVPRGNQRTAAPFLLDIVRATGQFGLQGQALANRCVAISEQCINDVETIGSPKPFKPGVGPSSMQLSKVSLGTLSLGLEYPPMSKITARKVFPERLFRDFVELTETYIQARYQKWGSKFVRDAGVEGLEASVFLSLSARQAWERRNVVYRGPGNPFDSLAWDRRKMKNMSKRCSQERGWDAALAITDYVTGYFQCSSIRALNETWAAFAKSPEFVPLKTQNLLDTPNRTLYVIGKFKFPDDPIDFHFHANGQDVEITSFLCALHIQLDLPTLDGESLLDSKPLSSVTYFNRLRTHNRLNGFFNCEQFFVPRIVPNKAFAAYRARATISHGSSRAASRGNSREPTPRKKTPKKNPFKNMKIHPSLLAGIPGSLGSNPTHPTQPPAKATEPPPFSPAKTYPPLARRKSLRRAEKQKKKGLPKKKKVVKNAKGEVIALPKKPRNKRLCQKNHPLMPMAPFNKADLCSYCELPVGSVGLIWDCARCNYFHCDACDPRAGVRNPKAVTAATSTGPTNPRASAVLDLEDAWSTPMEIKQVPSDINGLLDEIQTDVANSLQSEREEARQIIHTLQDAIVRKDADLRAANHQLGLSKWKKETPGSDQIVALENEIDNLKKQIAPLEKIKRMYFAQQKSSLHDEPAYYPRSAPVAKKPEPMTVERRSSVRAPPMGRQVSITSEDGQMEELRLRFQAVSNTRSRDMISSLSDFSGQNKTPTPGFPRPKNESHDANSLPIPMEKFTRKESGNSVLSGSSWKNGFTSISGIENSNSATYQTDSASGEPFSGKHRATSNASKSVILMDEAKNIPDSPAIKHYRPDSDTSAILLFDQSRPRKVSDMI